MSCDSSNKKDIKKNKTDSFIISSSTKKSDLSDNKIKDDTLRKEIDEYLEENSWKNRDKISNDSTEKLLLEGVLRSKK